MSKITMATIKSFIRKNEGKVMIKVKSKFDGMVDGVQSVEDSFALAVKSDGNARYTLGVQGAWFVGGSRDYFTEFNNDGIKGYEVYNCCGSFILGVAS